MKRKFRGNTQNLIILEEKIYSIRTQKTPTNAELNGEFNDNRLRIQIEPKISEEKKQKAHFEDRI